MVALLAGRKDRMKGTGAQMPSKSRGMHARQQVGMGDSQEHGNPRMGFRICLNFPCSNMNAGDLRTHLVQPCPMQWHRRRSERANPSGMCEHVNARNQNDRKSLSSFTSSGQPRGRDPPTQCCHGTVPLEEARSRLGPVEKRVQCKLRTP